jgi:hypothetical protein
VAGRGAEGRNRNLARVLEATRNDPLEKPAPSVRLFDGLMKVVSTGGGAGWADWTKAAPTEQVVNATSSYSRTLTTSLPTTVTLHIGCTGSPHK